jgi:SAM-dependent methyltransferase
VPAVLAAAEVAPGYRVLDVSTGTGEAALMTLPIVGALGAVTGADISSAMLVGARRRLGDALFWPVAADGQGLPFGDGAFDAVICQLGLQFFPDPARGLTEFRRVLRAGGRASVCVISAPERAPMWGILADVPGRYLPEQRQIINLSFALADPLGLERLFARAGFRDVRIDLQTREDVIGSFDEYWDPIEAGTGSLPQLYLSLSEVHRRSVREEVRARLAQFEYGSTLKLGAEMLIGRGRA